MEVKLQELGEGIESGDVLQVLVKEGDQIEKDQGIIELETDKATVEVPSTHGGRVAKVHVSAGETVPVGATLITLESADKAKEGEKKPAPKEKSEKPKAKSAGAEEKAEKKAPEKKKEAGKKAAAEAASADDQEENGAAEKETKAAPPAGQEPQRETAKTRPTAKSSAAQTAGIQRATDDDDGGEPVAASPAVRRFAREVGVDLRGVTGSGPGGRISREDVLEAVRGGNQATRRSGGTSATSTAGAPVAAGSSVSAQSSAPPGEASSDAWGPVRVERMSKIRRTIAAKMHESWTNIPRVTNVDDADVTELEKFRQSSKADYAERGIKLTSLPFVIKAVAMSIKAHPLLNASLDLEREQIVYKEYVNIGIAVDTDRGLIVPSLRNAERLSIPEVAKSLAEISETVRQNKYSIDDLRGSTFTISNLGAIGGSYSTPIINSPEVAILLVGRARKMPVVVDDQIAIRLMMPLSLSYDHRLVDGATAARFLNDVMGYLKAPSRLLLAP